MSRTELLAPAGNAEKLKYAYLYGADAAYVGLDSFSLRQKADNFTVEELKEAALLKGSKKLFCAINALFHQKDVYRLEDALDDIGSVPFDAFIVGDMGAARMLGRRLPGTPLHLSTQASCLNSEAVLAYRDMGFSRIILGRETSLDDIAEIRARVPEIELETFVHGAMCLAYSGRCFLSANLAGRSANEGSCAHACRWKWRVLEESERPGEYYPVVEEGEGGFTTILSSKDLCMIDHLKELKDAGVDSFKIEGRMKSLYYTAVVTRAYRKALDALEKPGEESPLLPAFRRELFGVSHREYSTGFFFGKEEIEESCGESYRREYLFLGTIGEETEPGTFILEPKNHFAAGGEIEYIGPEVPFLGDADFRLFELKGNEDRMGVECGRADHGKRYLIRPSVPVESGYIIRRKI